MLKEKGPSKRTTAQRGRGLATPVIDYTLRRIYKHFDQLAGTRQKELRAEFHDNKRFGKRWERLARSIGYGILIVCSKCLDIRNFADLVFGLPGLREPIGDWGSA